MRRPLFHLIDQIIRTEKYFDISRDQVERALSSAGKCEITTEHDLIDEDGQSVTAELRLNITATRPDVTTSWQMALKLHNMRIDGLDHETKYITVNGDTGHGWHRHQWIPSEDSAERGKVPITELDGIQSREEFLIRGFSVLRVRVSKTDYGIDFLPFDS